MASFIFSASSFRASFNVSIRSIADTNVGRSACFGTSIDLYNQGIKVHKIFARRRGGGGERKRGGEEETPTSFFYLNVEVTNTV